ncbi:uncharacterized protein LOC135396708 [Ornithodoros turicata]|uniref:uncharacterized protein LOC135396708 n=1 Tax=Ornithodoros turicata TaxID=34597 RepID=UPI0031399395
MLVESRGLVMLQLQAAILILAALLISCEESFTALPAALESKAHIVPRKIHKRPSAAQMPQASRDVRNILEGFQVNENRIIRTEDSRRMGAKYLNETEVGSNRDCIIWCWETTNCNVAVFEEKSKGSCYLFDCGPPSAFLCLFTSHAFYTVSLLLVGPRDTEWGLPSRHEDELTQLRQPPLLLSTEVPPEVPESQVPTLIPTATESATRITTAVPDTRCQRFQFQCQNSSECIAVYNVCDGIPQCPDGSDESDDLNCPGAKSGDKATAAPNSQTSSLPPTIFQADVTTTPSRGLSQTGDPSPPREPPPSNNINQELRGRPSPFHHKTGIRLPSVPRNELNSWPGDARQSQPSRSDYAPYGSDPYLGYQDKYDDYGAYTDNGRLWVGDNDLQLYPSIPEGAMTPQQARPQNQHSSLQQIPRFRQQEMQRQFRQQQILQQQQLQHQLQQQKQLAAMQGRGDKQWRMLHRPTPVLEQPEIPLQESSYIRPHPAVTYEGLRQRLPESPPLISNEPVRPGGRQLSLNIGSSEGGFVQHQSPKETAAAAPESEHTPMAAKPVAPPTSSNDNLYETVVEVEPPPVPEHHHGKAQAKQATKNKNKPHSTHPHPSVQFGSLSEVANMRVSFTQVEQAGRVANRESSSAVLALTLGLCVTGLLLVLVGCRLRLARHRLARRGGRSALAHDADYLVNGMYL